MALQMIYVDDEAPGECGDAGLVYNGSDTLTSSKLYSGTSIELSENISVGGTLAVTGNTTIGGILGVTGGFALDSVTVTGNTTVGGTLAVTGNTAIAGPLGVTGASTLASVLVTGASTLASVLVTGGIEINGGLTCDTNAFTVADHSGNTATRGTLDVLGATTLTGDLAANGHVTIATTKNLVGGADTDILMNTDKFTVAGATGNTVIAGTASVAGVTTHTAAVGFGGTVVAAANGAYVVPLTTMVTNVSTNATADLDASLADGQAGQLKIIIMDTDGGNDVVITPANFGNGTSLTLDTASDYAVFAFDGTEWWAISYSGTIA